MCTKEVRKGFTPSYFSLQDILASETRVPCKAEIGIANCGFLDPSQESPHLVAGSEIELPIWAARALSKQKRAFVSIKMSKFCGQSYLEVLKADPTVVDLNKMGPQYYQSALQMCTLPSGESERISEALPDILQKRIIAMADSYSLHRYVKSTDEVSNNQMGNVLKFHHMDPLEMQIFNDSKSASEDLDNWV